MDVPFRDSVKPASVRVDIVAYAPTEFFHCAHCEVVWNHVGLGRRWHADQRRSLLPPDLQAEYESISAWALAAAEHYGDRLQIRVIDAASLAGVATALRHRLHRFPAFVVGGRTRIQSFDRAQLDAALAEQLAPAPPGGRG